MNDGFEKIIEVILGHEGSEFTNNPADSGGPTKYGITQSDLKQCSMPNSKEDVEALTQEQAKQVYKLLYWETVLGIDSTTIATCVMDQCVIAGTPTVVRTIQEILALKIDSVMGPLTLSAINKQQTNKFCFDFLRAMNRHYLKVFKENPKNLDFLSGWEDRIFDLLHLVFL